MFIKQRVFVVIMILFVFTGITFAKNFAKAKELSDQVHSIWDNPIPANCPFERSKGFGRLVIMKRHKWYGNSDTWYPSWASDGHLYSGWTDSDIGGWKSYSGHGEEATTVSAKIIGDDPMNLRVKNLNKYAASARPYVGRYPCAYLVHDGVFYYGTYCLDIIDVPGMAAVSQQRQARNPAYQVSR